MEKLNQIIGTIFPYLLGGGGGATITILYQRWTNRLKVMHCCYVNDEIITRIPIISESGEQHDNIYAKEFLLKNTTGKDIPAFKIIFEFDANAKIIKQDTFCKTGKNEIRPKNRKLNESSFLIKNFNRNDEFQFFFDIANVTKDHFNITEADCLGFKITVKDNRKSIIKRQSRIVTKDKII